MPTKHVLIAEDAIDFARMLQATLTTVDSTIKTMLVPSAEEALLETARLSPDLLVSDIRLPGMSGIELITRVHKRFPAVRIIAMTGLKDPGLEEKALAAGADYFFPKPLSIGEFITAVQSLLDLKAAPAAAVPMLPPIQPPPVVIETTRLSDTLAALRQQVGALVAVLVDARGHVAARAGDFPDTSFETESLPAWLAALSSTEKAARTLGSQVGNAVVLQGADLEVLLLPLGELSLIIALKPARSALRMAYALDEALRVQKDLLAAAAALPQPAVTLPKTAELPEITSAADLTIPSVAAAMAPEPVDLSGLENIFTRPAGEQPAQDVNAFWEQAVEENPAETGSPDVLSYEQAARLGLTPEDEP